MWVQGKQANTSLLLVNNGVLPAVARLSMDSHPCFQLGAGPRLISLNSKESHRLTVNFNASEVKQHVHEVGCSL